MPRLFLLLGAAVLYCNSAIAGITLLSSGITGGPYGDKVAESANVQTLCVEGFVVLYIREPSGNSTVMQMKGSNSAPLMCDPCGLGVRESTKPQMSNEEYCRRRKEILGE